MGLVTITKGPVLRQLTPVVPVWPHRPQTSTEFGVLKGLAMISERTNTPTRLEVSKHSDRGPFTAIVISWLIALPQRPTQATLRSE